MKLFQMATNWNRKIVTSAGAISRTATTKKVRISPAPSSREASSSSFGTLEAAFARWIRQRLDMASDGGGTQGTNWVNWGIAFKMSVGAYLGDENLVSASAAQLRSLLDYQIDANGHLPEEVYRNTGQADHEQSAADDDSAG